MKKLSLFLIKAAFIVQVITANSYCKTSQTKDSLLHHHFPNNILDITPMHLQNEWPCNYDRYLVVDEVAINELWIKNALPYLDDNSVGIGKVDCRNDDTDVCQLLQAHHVVLFKKDHKDKPLPLKNHQLDENELMCALLELQADGLHVSCDTSNQVELIAKESGALVTLATDIEDKEYFKYLGGLPAIGKELQRPLITVYSSNVIPSEKISASLQSSLHIWFVVSIGDELQWLPMDQNSILEFVTSFKYPVIHDYHPMNTPGLFRDGDINIVYVLIIPDHRNSSTMEIIEKLAKKYIGHYCFVTVDFEYSSEITHIQVLPEQSPNVILKLKNKKEMLYTEIPFEYDALNYLLKDLLGIGPDIDPPPHNQLFIYYSIQDFNDAIRTSSRYLLTGFCRSSSCDRIMELLSRIASVASELHDNLEIALVEYRTTDHPPDGLVITHLPVLAFYDYTNQSWTEYQTKLSWKNMVEFLLKFIPIRNISEPVEIDFPPCKVEEDDPIGLLANRLGAADISNSSQLTDATIDSFFYQHKTSIVTFYQKWCERSKMFLHHIVALQHDLSGEVGVAIVSCSDWPDVCALYKIITYPTVLIFKDSEAIQYRGYMSATSILSSLPYYTAPVVQQLNTEGESVDNFITNCARDGRAGVVGIFPDGTTPSYAHFLSVATLYHGRRLFGVLVSSEVPEDLPVEVTKLPAVIKVESWGSQLVTDPEQLETTLLGSSELTPETLPRYISVRKPLLVLVVNDETDFRPLVEVAANLYPLVTWMNYEKHGGIIERYLSTCSQPPIMLVFDFSARVVYNGGHCGEQLSPGEVESSIIQLRSGLLSSVEFESREWKPVEKPFLFPSPDEPPSPDEIENLRPFDYVDDEPSSPYEPDDNDLHSNYLHTMT